MFPNFLLFINNERHWLISLSFCFLISLACPAPVLFWLRHCLARARLASNSPPILLPPFLRWLPVILAKSGLWSLPRWLLPLRICCCGGYSSVMELALSRHETPGSVFSTIKTNKPTKSCIWWTPYSRNPEMSSAQIQKGCQNYHPCANSTCGILFSHHNWPENSILTISIRCQMLKVWNAFLEI